MAGRDNGRVYECIVVDLNTQRDFCDADGVSPVANLDTFIPAVRHMVAWAKRNYAPVISSIESHRPGELSDSGYPLCCVDGSTGQQKIGFTIFPAFAYVEADNTLSCPIDLFRRCQQVIFRKRSDDLLSNPKADRFLTQLPATEFALFGVGTEGSIKALALGLLAREKHVTVVANACGYWSKAIADLALRQIAAKGGQIITVEELLHRRLSRGRRYPSARKRPTPAGERSRPAANGQRKASAKTDPLTGQLPRVPKRPRVYRSDGKAGRKDL